MNRFGNVEIMDNLDDDEPKVDYPAVVAEIERLWSENLSDFLTTAHGIEIFRLLNALDDFKLDRIDCDELIFEAKSVVDCTWEKLNVGKWMNVPVETKQVYAIASFVQIIGLLHSKQPKAIEKSLEVTDLGILLGFPFRTISLTQVADILSGHINRVVSSIGEEVRKNSNSSSDSTSKIGNRSRQLESDSENEIETVRCPSLEYFYKNYLSTKRPVKLTGCMDHWPALKLWTDFGYIINKAGCRTVPIEIGKNYADEEYSQKLMKISDFVRDFMRDDADKIGYLAQHQLFDQVPELKRDIIEPDYCALSLNAESRGETEINAWFGPRGTVSPLHFDPKNNLLCQVVGTKKVVLHPPSDTPYLYPFDGSLLFNTSRVDVENPNLTNFPKYKEAFPTKCLLRPGEMLFIPPGHWHHVRSLEKSFSVSFWWE